MGEGKPRGDPDLTTQKHWGEARGKETRRKHKGFLSNFYARRKEGQKKKEKREVD